jgi:hypothetical protein
MSFGSLSARVRRIGVLAAGTALLSVPASAQTLFTWPDTTVGIAAYTTIEECQAAVVRSLGYTDSRKDLVTGVWEDTLPLDSLDERGPRPLAVEVVETARRCGQRFSGADTVSLSNFYALLRLYLQAGWDAKARTLVDRRLTAIEDRSGTKQAAVLDSVRPVLLALGNRVGAPRYALAEDLVDTWAPRVMDRAKRLNLYLNTASFYGTNPDSATTARVLRIAQKMSVIMDSLNQHEIDAVASTMGTSGDGAETGADFARRYYALLNMVLGKPTFLDSLRESTAAYVKLKRDNWAKATGMLPESYRMGDPLGEHAKPIEADIWLGYDPSKGPRPTPGRVSLVVFLDNHECNGAPTDPSLMQGDCARNLVPLRRLEQRFPDLEITVVSQTHGHFLYLKDGITPQREAELTKQWLEAHGVDAPLAMATTDVMRLPDPDSRRFERPSSNDIDYAFGTGDKVPNGQAFLIDPDGIVVHTRSMNRFAVYEDFTELIEVLLERQRRVSEVRP